MVVIVEGWIVYNISELLNFNHLSVRQFLHAHGQITTLTGLVSNWMPTPRNSCHSKMIPKDDIDYKIRALLGKMQFNASLLYWNRAVTSSTCYRCGLIEYFKHACYLCSEALSLYPHLPVARTHSQQNNHHYATLS